MSVAWIAFVIAFPCTAAALFLSGMEGKIKNLKFPFIYVIVGWGSLVGSGLATTAIIWHYWDLAGKIFAALAVVLLLVCLFYDTIMRIRNNVLSMTQVAQMAPASAPTSSANAAPASASPPAPPTAPQERTN